MLRVVNYKDICAICGKTTQTALNRPHSQHKTKRLVRPNLTRWEGLRICAQCRKGLNKPERVRKAQPKETPASAIAST